MGIRWVFEGDRTRNAFLLTFLFPFIGGFLYARNWLRATGAVIAAPILIILLYVVFGLVLDAIYPRLPYCDPPNGFFGDGCSFSTLDAAGVRHNEIFDLFLGGALVMSVIAWLVFFGVCAARLVRHQPNS